MKKRRFLSALLGAVLILTAATGSAIANTATDALFARVRSVYDLVEIWHKDGASAEAFTKGAIRGGLEALGDKYTNYFSPQEFNEFLDSLNGNFSGIGAYLEQDGNYVVVSSPIKGAPAARAGLETGDRIIEVDNVSLVGSTTDKAVQLIRGAVGTSVVLKIERPSEKRVFTLTITREQITIPEVEYRMLDDQIGYLQLASFGDDSRKDFYEGVNALKAQGAKGLVLDLRQNGGGYLHAAIDIAGAFIPKDEYVVWEVTKNDQTIHRSNGRLINLPSVVLVDGGSASASEVLAGAIQDHRAAPLVGVKTFGKGTVQQILSLVDGGGMKVTTAEYLTPLASKVDGVGLTPDIVVENRKPDPERTQALEFNRLLLPSSVGLDVLYIQYRLQDLGYRTESHGFFGINTTDAVSKFRQEHHLSAEAKVDEAFIEALNQAVAGRLKSVQQEDPQLDKAVEVLKSSLK